METQPPPNYQAGHRRDVDGQWQSVSWSPANVQGVARQVLGWSGVVTRQPLSAGRNPETAGGTTKNKTHAAVVARQLL